MKTHTKRLHERAVRTTLSFNPRVFEAGEELVKKGGYDGLSELISAYIRHASGLDGIVRSAPAPAPLDKAA